MLQLSPWHLHKSDTKVLSYSTSSSTPPQKKDGFSGIFKLPQSKLRTNRDTMTKSVSLPDSTINTTYVAGTWIYTKR